VQRHGHRSQDNCFTVYARANNFKLARLGITVSRKTSSIAVVRNRLKRQVRESFRAWQNELKGMDLVVVARSAATGKQNKAIIESLQHHWGTQIRSCARC